MEVVKQSRCFFRLYRVWMKPIEHDRFGEPLVFPKTGRLRDGVGQQGQCIISRALFFNSRHLLSVKIKLRLLKGKGHHSGIWSVVRCLH